MSSKTNDIQHTPIGNLAWSDSNVEASLQKVYDAVTGEAREIYDWYLRKKEPKRRGGLWLRFFQILFGAAAGIHPLVVEAIGADRLGPVASSGVWTSIAVAIAGGLIALDQLFGFSKSWMRYTNSAMQLLRLLEGFELLWQQEKALWGNEPPKPKQVQKLIAVAAGFVGEMKGIVVGETQAWSGELAKALKKLEKVADEEGKGKPKDDPEAANGST